jgi:hypothetical protein
MTATLDAFQIEAAIQFVDERRADVHRPMLPHERTEWAEVLAYVREGELKPVIERWTSTVRPPAGAVLDYILTNRSRVIAAPKEPPAPDLGGRYTPVVVDSIAEAREAIQRRLDARLVSCSPDPR